MKIFAAILYILVFIPLWALRYAFGISRFGSRFHNKESAWDSSIIAHKVTKNTAPDGSCADEK